jgi:hypothetical protein
MSRVKKKEMTKVKTKLEGMNPAHGECSEPISDQDIRFAILQEQKICEGMAGTPGKKSKEI